MKQPVLWSSGALLATVLISACSTPPDTPLVTSGSSSGCGAQVLSATEEPFGTLEVRVVDGQDKPLSGQTVSAWREVYTGAKCASRVEGTTDAQGKVTFERLKTGPFGVTLPGGMTQRIQTEVMADQTTSITLVRTTVPSPSPSP